MTTLAIIGTAGRKEDAGLLSGEHYERMIRACEKFISHLNLNCDQLQLVSGGAAWADHLVVSLGLKGIVPCNNITLFLPCVLEYYGYEGVRGDNNSQRTADTANYYHKLFSEKIGRNSIQEIRTLGKCGATLEVIDGGFFARNSRVALSLHSEDYLLAFTFGDTRSKQPDWTIRTFSPSCTASKAGLKDGGTAHTWDRVKLSKKAHGRIGTNALTDDIPW